jgi:hypothetical protein
MPEYRRLESGGFWHWCRNCPEDPKAAYMTRNVRPDWDEALCLQCPAKEADCTCEHALGFVAASPRRLY